ncbi:MAG: Flp pilus assembly protein CpaB [Acidobacteriota bacterium]|nr:Flp pilus assembly protein CpaB [Acidobacteriota bacterium]
MNRGRLLIIGVVALALGAGASVMVYRDLQAHATPNGAPTEDVVLAMDDLQLGTKITDRDLKVVRLPSTDLPPNRFHQKSKIIGRGVILPIAKGEFILPNKLAGENAGSGLAALIPPGMRAMSVRVTDTSSVAGFVLPGTRVDVLLTGNPGGANEQQTTTVLENVTVIATGQKLERASGSDAQTASVITLLVSPDDAAKLTLASTEGQIQLVLRNSLDTQSQKTSVSSGSLYNVAPPKPVIHAKPRRVAVPATVAPYMIEVYKGDKKEEDKF